MQPKGIKFMYEIIGGYDNLSKRLGPFEALTWRNWVENNGNKNQFDRKIDSTIKYYFCEILVRIIFRIKTGEKIY